MKLYFLATTILASYATARIGDLCSYEGVS